MTLRMDAAALRAAGKTRARSKYHNRRGTVADGYRFDSKAEANRYRMLRILEAAGEISDLRLQPEFVLLGAFVDADGKAHRAVSYRGDFSYIEVRTGKAIVEDVKGMETAVFKLKRKLFVSRYGIELRLIRGSMFAAARNSKGCRPRRSKLKARANHE